MKSRIRISTPSLILFASWLWFMMFLAASHDGYYEQEVPDVVVESVYLMGGNAIITTADGPTYHLDSVKTAEGVEVPQLLQSGDKIRKYADSYELWLNGELIVTKEIAAWQGPRLGWYFNGLIASVSTIIVFLRFARYMRGKHASR